MNPRKLGSKELRKTSPSPEELAAIKRNPIYLVLDNVLDTYNIGSIFRLADAVAAKKIYLCGQSETPPNSRIAKAAVGTEKWVPWQYERTANDAVAKIKNQISNIKIVAIEQSKKSIDYRKADYREPVAFVVGNETEGLSQEALKLVDQIVEIPMFGVNRSLNVMVSLAIVLYRAIR